MLSFLSDLNVDGLMIGIADILIRITIVLALGYGIGMCLRRQSASFRHGWWLATLIAVACVPVAFFLFPDWGTLSPLLSQTEPAASSPTAGNSSPVLTVVEHNVEFSTAGDQQTGSSRAERTSRARHTDQISETREATVTSEAESPIVVQPIVESPNVEQQQFHASSWVFGVWMIGCLLFLVQFAMGLARISRILKSAKLITEQVWHRLATEAMSKLGFQRTVTLQESTVEIGPLTGGLIRPFVLLPAGCDTWSNDLRRVVLLHELAHAKRRDILSLWWSRLVGAVLWFHPLVWLVIRQLRFEQERACDDLVLAAGTRPSVYSQHLVEIASTYRCPKWTAATAMTMAAKSQLEDRVRCVLADNRNRRVMRTGTALAIGMLLVGLATTVATAGRVIVRDANGKTIATLQIPDGGSVTIEDDKAGSAKPLAETTRDGWNQLGGSPQRNNVSPATRLPNKWNTATGENIKWSADLGSQTYGSPVIADGKIFIGTNNGRGYVKRHPAKTDLGCLLCFDQETGEFLWQHSNEKLPTGRVHDWPLQGVASTPVVHGKRLYYLTNRAVVTCLDIEGQRDGDAGPFKDKHAADDDADVVWQYDLIKELGVSPKSMSGCSPTTDGERLYVLTSNGTDESYAKTPSPNAPSFVCFDLKTGKLLWSAKAAFAANDCQWNGPTVGTFVDADGKKQTQVIFPGSDGWLYSFDPNGDGKGNAKLLWKFDCNPKDAKFLLGGRGRRNLHVSMPVIHNGLIYVATGRNPEAGDGDADLWCIDPKRRTGGHDISESIALNKDGEPLAVTVNSFLDKSRGDVQVPNPHSGVVWHHTGADLDGDGRTKFEDTFHRTWGGPAIHNGLVIIADFSGLVHCLSADSGKRHWTYDLYAACWSSPLIADGCIFVSDEDGEVTILKLGKTLQMIAEVECGGPVYSTPVAVGDTLYVHTNRKLLAIRKSKIPKSDDTAEAKAVGSRANHVAEARPKPMPLKPKAEPAPAPASSRRQLGVPSTSWASSRNGDGQRGVATSALPEKLSLRWKLQSPDGWVSSVAVVGDRVYAPSLNGYLYCVGLHSGNIEWKYRSIKGPNPKTFAPGFKSAPRVTSDTIYVGDEDGVLHCVDRATGELKWTFTTGGEISGSPAIAGDRIIFGSHDSHLYCLKLDGSLLWRFQTDDRINCSPAIHGDYTFIAGCDSLLRVIDIRTGKEVRDIPLNSYLVASPAVVGDRLYVGTNEAEVVAVDWKTGEIVWRYTDDRRHFPFHASASVTDSRVFIGGHDKQFHCVDRISGKPMWKFLTKAKISSSSAVVDGRVFFGSDDGNIYGLRASDGKEVWRFNAGKRISAGVAIGEGHLLVGENGTNGSLYCFGKSER